MHSMAVIANAVNSAVQQIDFCIVRESPNPSLELAWRDCLDRVNAPAHYNAPEYFADPAVASARPFAVLATKENRITGVLTGAHEGDHACSGLMSRPQICIDRTADASATVQALARGFLAEAGNAKLLTIYSWFPLEKFTHHGFRERMHEGVVVLDLAQGPDSLFKQFDKKRREGIRSAMRRIDEVFSPKRMEDVEALYGVYSAWYRDTPKKIEGEKIPFEVFEQRSRLKGNYQVFLARHSGRVIAGLTLRFLSGGLIEASNMNSLRDSLALRPNDLLFWHAIQWACREGFSKFSLGGAHRFLREFGGTVTPIYRYRLDRTPLRQHDLRENLMDWGRTKLRQMPRPLEAAVRRIVGKPVPKITRSKTS
jgi:hypothetical protein